MTGVTVVAQNAESNPTSRLLAALALIGGVLVALASLFADSLGISGGGDGFGWKQLIGTIAGSAVALLGLAWLLRPGVSGS